MNGCSKVCETGMKHLLSFGSVLIGSISGELFPIRVSLGGNCGGIRGGRGGGGGGRGKLLTLRYIRNTYEVGIRFHVRCYCGLMLSRDV